MALETISNQVSEELNLRDYWHIAVRRWRLIASTAAFVLVVGTLVTILQVPTYRAAATVLVEDRESSQLAILEGLSSIGGAIPVETEMEILKSRTLAEEVVRELSLDVIPINAPIGTRLRLTNYRSSVHRPDDSPEFRIVFRDQRHYVAYDDERELGIGVLGEPFVGRDIGWTLNVTSPENVSSIRFVKVPFQDAVKELQDSTSVKEVGKKTNVIAVTVEAPDPYAAREIADKITEAYLAYNVARKSQVATQTLDFIGQQLDSIRGNLESGEQELGEYKSRKGIFVLSDSAKSIIEQIGDLERAKTEFELQERDVSNLVNALDKAADEDRPYILGQVSLADPVVGSLVSELSKDLIELRKLRQELNEDNPKVTLLKAQIDESKAKVRLAVSNARRSLTSRVATVKKLIAGYEDRLRQLPESERQLAILTRKSEVNAELYTFLLKKHEEARIARAGIVGNVRILDAALVPTKPESPKKKRNMGLSLLVGMFAGVMIAFLFEYLDDTLKRVEDVSSTLGLGIFGVIPYVEHSSDQPVVVQKLDPRGIVPEAFRSLRTNIQFTDSELEMKSIVAVSALPGVGKSTTIVNLGVTLAQGGKRVLLVDCDLRRPQIHRFFDLPSEPGLTNGLLSGSDWRIHVIDKTSVENLSVMPAGVLPPNPAEFLGSNRFQAFMREVVAAYDFVLFDVPPIVAFTDAALVAARVDAVFMILELGGSRLPLLKRALELLANVQAKVRGAIINKADAARLGGHGYGYYSYGYQSYYDQEPSPREGLLARIWAWVIR